MPGLKCLRSFWNLKKVRERDCDGLDIGGETPEEIAISIAAEIISAKKGKLEALKKKGVMHNVTE
jgi:xanthine/CO dehydrogenase XdhC/CoxF family maturation factor